MILQLVAEVIIILYLILFIAQLGQSFSGSLGWFIALGVLYFIQWTWFLWQAANSKRDSAITQTLRNILSHASFKHFKPGSRTHRTRPFLNEHLLGTNFSCFTNDILSSTLGYFSQPSYPGYSLKICLYK